MSENNTKVILLQIVVFVSNNSSDSIEHIVGVFNDKASLEEAKRISGQYVSRSNYRFKETVLYVNTPMQIKKHH